MDLDVMLINVDHLSVQSMRYGQSSIALEVWVWFWASSIVLSTVFPVENVATSSGAMFLRLEPRSELFSASRSTDGQKI